MSVHPSLYRVQSKRVRKYDPQWFRKALDKAFTQEEWVRKFREELTAKEQFDTLSRLQPKEFKQDIASTFTLNFIGLDRPAIQGEVIAGELDEHKEEDE